MSIAKLTSRALIGMTAPEVTVEVDVAPGLPAFSIVGLADTEVKESRDRVRSALQNSGFQFPARRITVNLAPADLPKQSSRYDLPIAVGILLASGLLAPSLSLNEFEFAGELALDGQLRAIQGSLALAVGTQKSGRKLLITADSAAEASLVNALKVYPVTSLSQAYNFLSGNEVVRPLSEVSMHPASIVQLPIDLVDIKGQIAAKKALEIAAAGRHSLLLLGSPGCGKSMLAERLITILPQLKPEQALASATLHSLSKQGFQLANFGQIPFRHPHHSSSVAALLGGGLPPKPGEISLAHQGVLFLDELSEFARKVLEALREPLETKKISLARSNYHVEYPANFQLIAAMNPCPCGNYMNNQLKCRCTSLQIARYQAKISGPLLDRIDLQVTVPLLTPTELQELPSSENSANVRARVVHAQQLQYERQNKLNYALSNPEVEKFCILRPQARRLLSDLMVKLNLSARAYFRLLKLGRTIADLAHSQTIQGEHIALASQYRLTSWQHTV